MNTEAMYVWEVWNFLGCSRPHVKRYRLVRLNPKGGATVTVRGGTSVIKAATGRHLFTEESEMKAYVRRICSQILEDARNTVAQLEVEMEQENCGVQVDEIRDTPYVHHPNLKLTD